MFEKNLNQELPTGNPTYYYSQDNTALRWYRDYNTMKNYSRIGISKGVNLENDQNQNDQNVPKITELRENQIQRRLTTTRKI